MARKRNSGAGIDHWMRVVLQKWRVAAKELGDEPIHELRTSLRRCRSMAGDLARLDPDPGWKNLNRQAKGLFKSLGELRDTHVMAHWLTIVAPPDDAVRVQLEAILLEKGAFFEAQALLAITQFDRTKWKRLQNQLARRVAIIPPDHPAFAHQGVVRWQEAYTLHRFAIRSRSKVAFHNLRIGIKKLRYLVENFLPTLHRQWGKDLKVLQEALGNVHDLDVLWDLLPQTGSTFDAAARRRWKQWIGRHRHQHLQSYRAKMVGRGALWPRWRAQLPQGAALELAGQEKITAWSRLLDPSPEQTENRMAVTLKVYDAFSAAGLSGPFDSGRYRALLAAAVRLAAVQNVLGGRKKLLRRVHKLELPIGWEAKDLQVLEQLLQHQNRVSPRFKDQVFSSLDVPTQRAVLGLAGTLSLGQALVSAGLTDPSDFDLEVLAELALLQVADERLDRKSFFSIAASRSLLEWATERTVAIRRKGHHALRL